MDDIDYKILYTLQDKVLDAVFQAEQEFYLTGGTCLNRFYFEKRYSDDLDFFTNQSHRYSFAIRNIREALNKSFASIFIETESKSFTRLVINGLLQVDFVNDVDYRYKEPLLHQGKYLIDNVENILSNKLTAVIGRDNPKDIFDIYLIWKFYKFDWQVILKAAHQKAVFSDEELLIRLKSFPASLLATIKLVDTAFLDNFDSEFTILINELELHT